MTYQKELINKNELVERYLTENLTLKQLHDIYKVNRMWIRNVLKECGVVVSKKNKLKKFSEEHRNKISKAMKGKKYNRTTSRTDTIRKITANRKVSLHETYIDQFDDLEKFIFLSKIVSRHIKQHFNTEEKLKSFFDKFYFDKTFNVLYSVWRNSGKNPQLRPSIDHDVPLSKKGLWNIENLSFLSWFENRLKRNMTMDEWHIFKHKTQTESQLFI
jgi:hypothetical protein